MAPVAMLSRIPIEKVLGCMLLDKRFEWKSCVCYVAKQTKIIRVD